jgi:hypothetical protein
MKQIPLSNGGEVIVDDQDVAFLEQWSWHRTRDGYAARCVWIGEPRKLKRIWMHREILGLTGSLCDHINRNKLDNRRSNLRRATFRLNSLNGREPGVQKSSTNRWSVCVGKPALYFGSFASKDFAIAIAKFVRASLIYQEETA